MYSLPELENMVGPSRGITPTNMTETTDLHVSDPVDRLLQGSLAATIPAVSLITSDRRGKSLLELRFWDGSEALKVFPDHLKAQLEQAYRETDQVLPDCIKSRWPLTQQTSISASGRSCRWLDPDTDEEILVARFHYGPAHQILIAKQRIGTSINGGAPFIILSTGGYFSYKREGQDIRASKWDVWEPVSCSNEPQYIVRDFQTRDSNDTTYFEEIPSVVDFTNVPDTKRLTDLATIPVGSDDKSRTGSDDRAQIANSILAMRKSDNVLVQIRCPHCEIDTCASDTELYDHLRTLHGVMLDGYDKVAELYGVPVPHTPRRSARKRRTTETGLGNSASVPKRTRNLKPRRRRVNIAQRSRPIRNTVPKEERRIPIRDLTHHNSHEPASFLPTTHTSIPHLVPALLDQKALGPGSIKDEVQCNFTFINTTTQQLRTRPFASCDTVRKLFVQAHVAGVTTKDDLVLSCTVNPTSTMPLPIYVVRGDEEDFASLVAAIDQAKQQRGGVAITIFVTAERLD